MADLIKSSGDGQVSASLGGKAPPNSSRGHRGQSLVGAVSGGDASALRSGSGKGQVPSRERRAVPASQRLPNASIIYGVGASVLFVLALGMLFNGLWLTALLVVLAAASFLGFAIHYIRVDSLDERPYG